MLLEESLPSTPVDERLNELNELQSQSDGSQSQSVLCGLSQVVDDACGAVIEVVASSNNSFAGVSSSGESSIQPHDSCMAEPWSAQKRVASDISPSDGSSRARSKVRGRKVSRTQGPHIPPGVSSAASLARSRSSSSSRSSSRL